MKKLYLSKHKNGYYYICYRGVNGKRQSITTKTRVKSEALNALSRFDELIKTKFKEDPKQLNLKQFRWKFLKHSESYHSWKTTLDYKSSFNEMEEYFGNILLTEFTQRNIEEFIPALVIIIGIIFILRGMNLGIKYVSPKTIANIHSLIPNSLQ